MIVTDQELSLRRRDVLVVGDVEAPGRARRGAVEGPRAVDGPVAAGRRGGGVGRRRLVVEGQRRTCALVSAVRRGWTAIDFVTVVPTTG